jgi:hypothetical protein
MPIYVPMQDGPVVLEMTAETAAASTTPEPFGKPSGPGLWRVKGMMLPAYVQHVAHDLMEQGSASSVSQAIQMAVGIIKKWASGTPVGGETKVGHPAHPGHIHPDVQAAAQKAIAEWNQKRARAHAQAAASAAARSEHSVTVTEDETVDLATVVRNASTGYAPVSRQSREHVHRPSNEPTHGGLKPVDQMTGQEVRHHMATMHSEDVDGVKTQTLRAKHNSLHKAKADNPPNRDNGSMSSSKKRGPGRPLGSKNKPKPSASASPTADTRGGPGSGGVGTGKANSGYPTTPDPTRSSAPSDHVMGTEHYTAPDSGPNTTSGKHSAPSTPTQAPPSEIAQTMRPLKESGASRQVHPRNYPKTTATPEKGAGRQTMRPNYPRFNKSATPSTGQITGAQAPPAAVRAAAIARANSRTTKVHSYTYDAFGREQIIELAAVPSPTAATRKAALKKGEALPPKGGGGAGEARFPLTNRTLASRAVKMVGLAKDKDTVRAYIKRVLTKKGWTDLIPEGWS